MKSGFLIALLSAGLSYSACAQGVVAFKNFGTGGNGTFGTTPARVFNVDGVTGLAGTGFTAQLWGGANADSLQALTPTVNFGTGLLAGLFSPNSTVAVPGVAVGSVATLRVRVWDNQSGAVTSWDAATIRGESNTFTVSLVDSQNPNPPILIGMNSFTLVPEPSVIALALLGAGALLFRRKKA
jgi:hypothetical protein